MERLSFDGVLIAGAGLAGLSAALACAPRPALVLAPVLGEACATAWAQGGIAAAVGAGDTAELHAADSPARPPPTMTTPSKRRRSTVRSAPRRRGGAP